MLKKKEEFGSSNFGMKKKEERRMKKMLQKLILTNGGWHAATAIFYRGMLHENGSFWSFIRGVFNLAKSFQTKGKKFPNGAFSILVKR